MPDKPIVLIAYSHDSAAHQQRVRDLAQALLDAGIDCRFDGSTRRPSGGWERWLGAELDAARTVLVVCTSTIARRFKRAAVGEGHDWEAKLVLDRMRRDRDRFVAVLFEGAKETDVPVQLHSAPRHWLPKDLSTLIRALGSAPEAQAPSAEIERLGERAEQLIMAGEDPTSVLQEIERLKSLIDDGPPLEAGVELEGRYKLHERLDAGGFAEVWKAFDKQETAAVAVKILRTRYGREPSRRDRFFQAAGQMAKLSHQGIVRVRRPRVVDGERCFFVMDLAWRGSLDERAQKEKLDPSAVVRLIGKVGEALQYAHDRGVVHGDLRPPNILLGAGEEPLITNFVLSSSDRASGGLGTFGWAAPEALQDRALANARSDQYSLAMVAASLLLGHELPLRDAVYQTTRFVQSLPCSIFVKRVLHRALSHDESDRYESIGDFCAALGEASLRVEPLVGDSLEAVVITNDGMTSFPLKKSEKPLTIGRRASSDIPIDPKEDAVSSDHAYLHVGERVLIEDRKSVNGTSVLRMNPEKHHGTRKLADVGTRRATDVVPTRGRGDAAASAQVEVRPGDTIILGRTVKMMIRYAPALGPRVSANLGISGPTTASARADEPVLNDPAMRRAYEEAYRLASTSAHILLVGEPAVGKVTLAQAIHRRSPRAAGPFSVLSCTGEVEPREVAQNLFGHGTGNYSLVGQLELMRGGTLFIDEVGALLPRWQDELARVLHEGTVRRDGGSTPRATDVRLICSTSEDIEALVAAGRFSAELEKKLETVMVRVPPLRERPGDIAELARAFAESAAAQYGRMAVPTLTKEVIEALEKYAWPGNVAELKTTIERAVALREGPVIYLNDLPAKVIPR